MNILWIVNTWLPEISSIRKKSQDPFGGWLHETSIRLSKKKDIKLSILYPSLKDDSFKIDQGEKITYYAFPRNHMKLKKDLWISFFNVHPFDLIHIHGTEQDYHLPIISILKDLNRPYVISMQGLITKIAEKYLSDLPEHIVLSQTCRDRLKKDSIKKQQEKLFQHSQKEKEILSFSRYVIGRTRFDQNYVQEINPNIRYFHVNESLRKSFYEHKWTYQEPLRYSLFMSQGSYPIKGLHTLLNVMHMLKEKYPYIKLSIAGEDIFKKGLISNLRRNSYSSFILKLIKSYDLENHVTFLGILHEKDMIDVYLNHYLYILPSYMENSSNSLAEAMILGMPIISSTEGGSIEFLSHERSGLYTNIYDIDDMYQKLDYALSHPKKMIEMGQHARQEALKRFDIEVNVNELINVYQAILKENMSA